MDNSNKGGYISFQDLSPVVLTKHKKNNNNNITKSKSSSNIHLHKPVFDEDGEKLLNIHNRK